jgi:hypothetical protein
VEVAAVFLASGDTFTGRVILKGRIVDVVPPMNQPEHLKSADMTAFSRRMQQV